MKCNYCFKLKNMLIISNDSCNTSKCLKHLFNWSNHHYSWPGLSNSKKICRVGIIPKPRKSLASTVYRRIWLCLANKSTLSQEKGNWFKQEEEGKTLHSTLKFMLSKYHKQIIVLIRASCIWRIRSISFYKPLMR